MKYILFLAAGILFLACENQEKESKPEPDSKFKNYVLKDENSKVIDLPSELNEISGLAVKDQYLFVLFDIIYRRNVNHAVQILIV